jgi:hypothetical protein
MQKLVRTGVFRRVFCGIVGWYVSEPASDKSFYGFSWQTFYKLKNAFANHQPPDSWLF